MMPAYKVTFRCYEGPRQRRPISEAEFIQVAEFSYIPAEMSKEFKSTESFHYWAAPSIKPYLGQFNQPWESNLLAVNLFPVDPILFTVQSYCVPFLQLIRLQWMLPPPVSTERRCWFAWRSCQGCLPRLCQKMHMSAVHINQNDRV